MIQVIFVQASPPERANVVRRYYSFFVVRRVVTAACVWLFVPETLGKSLEEVNEVFGDTFVAIHIADRIEPEKLETSDHVETVEVKASREDQRTLCSSREQSVNQASCAKSCCLAYRCPGSIPVLQDAWTVTQSFNCQLVLDSYSDRAGLYCC